MTIDAATMLEAGADNIERNGWWQDSMDGPLESVCAILSMSRLYPDSTVGDEELAHFIGGESIDDVVKWNDAPGQTKENVIATMRACAAIWRAKQENTDANDTRPQVCIPERSRDEPAGISGEAVRRDTVSAGDD